MPKKNLEFYENAPLPAAEVAELINDEIESAPTATNELIERLRENTAASPANSGGDIDADWEEVNSSGEESFSGSNPTPDQSDVEENTHAYGIDFQDNEPLDFVDKMERRDNNRWELEEASKQKRNTI